MCVTTEAAISNTRRSYNAYGTRWLGPLMFEPGERCRGRRGTTLNAVEKPEKERLL
jgi:hypothetical protein